MESHTLHAIKAHQGRRESLPWPQH